MTTTSICGNCGVRMSGIVVQCPECGSERIWAEVSTVAPITGPPGPEAPATTYLPGCWCGRCVEVDRGFMARCRGGSAGFGRRWA